MARIVLDCDDVLADLGGALMGALRAAGKTDLTLDDLNRWDWSTVLGPEAWEATKELLARPEFWRGLPEVAGAADSVAELVGAGHEVLVATAPWTRCDGWADARRAWVGERLGVPGERVFITAVKSEVPGHVFLDDKPENVEVWAAVHGDAGAFLFNAHHNRAAACRFPRLHGWGRGTRDALLRAAAGSEKRS